MHKEKLFKLKEDITNAVAKDVGYDPTEIKRANVESLVFSSILLEVLDELKAQTELLKGLKVDVQEIPKEPIKKPAK